MAEGEVCNVDEKIEIYSFNKLGNINNLVKEDSNGKKFTSEIVVRNHLNEGKLLQVGRCLE